ncbi:MAG: bifunctional 4-hydroxy-2-oxoglutarate aldolase/2-dehydro-3-deoxy-phosphogluconate aldolase [Christensenellaceae bacterium]|nr:bifunctional 4-hydroxy-2-oxoglutarate aldolase/2-dehydro-3-deoxy-phosphogluconate aldolase [Christensenellaceae bacterium]
MIEVTRAEVFKSIEKHKLVAVIRGNSLADVISTVDRLLKAGIKLIEITFTIPSAHEVLKAVASEFKNSDMILGAGTVLDSETARIAILAGANFIVSPGVLLDVIKLCNRYSVAVIPGVRTPSEILTVLEYGVDLVKLFPADLQTLKALKGPFPNVRFMVTGGVDASNLKAWFSAGAFAVGSSSALTRMGVDIASWTSQI